MSATSVSVTRGFPPVPEYLVDANEHRRQIARKLNTINQGKFNCTIDVTLNANTGATLIADNRIGYRTAVTPLMAQSLSAAVALAAGIWFDPPRAGAGSTTPTIVAHHTNSAATDQKIRFGIFG